MSQQRKLQLTDLFHSTNNRILALAADLKLVYAHIKKRKELKLKLKLIGHWYSVQKMIAPQKSMLKIINNEIDQLSQQVTTKRSVLEETKTRLKPLEKSWWLRFVSLFVTTSLTEERKNRNTLSREISALEDTEANKIITRDQLQEEIAKAEAEKNKSLSPGDHVVYLALIDSADSTAYLSNVEYEDDDVARSDGFDALKEDYRKKLTRLKDSNLMTRIKHTYGTTKVTELEQQKEVLEKERDAAQRDYHQLSDAPKPTTDCRRYALTGADTAAKPSTTVPDSLPSLAELTAR